MVEGNTVQAQVGLCGRVKETVPFQEIIITIIIIILIIIIIIIIN